MPGRWWPEDLANESDALGFTSSTTGLLDAFKEQANEVGKSIADTGRMAVQAAQRAVEPAMPTLPPLQAFTRHWQGDDQQDTPQAPRTLPERSRSTTDDDSAPFNLPNLRAFTRIWDEPEKPKQPEPSRTATTPAADGVADARPAAPGGTPQAMPTGQGAVRPGASAPAASETFGPISEGDPEKFFATAGPYARRVEQQTGVPAALSLAIAANETGYGQRRYMAGANNFHGIQAQPGEAGAVPYKDWRPDGSGGQQFYDAAQRSFADPGAGFDGFASFIKDNKRYAPAMERYQQTGDVEQLARDIHAAGYAEDPKWSDKLISIMRGIPTSTGVGEVMAQPGVRPASQQVPPEQTRASGSPYTQQALADAGDPDAWSKCGPVAAFQAAMVLGRPAKPDEVERLAKQYGWTPQNGMAGLASEQQLLGGMGIAARAEQGVNWQAVIADVQRGNPVLLQLPNNGGHYITAQGYDPQTGAINFGSTVGDLRAAKHRTKLTPSELEGLGWGTPTASLYLDNPATPAPSVVAGRSSTAGSSSPAESPPAPRASGGDLAAAGSGDSLRTSLNEPGQGDTMQRQALGQPLDEADQGSGGPERDPRRFTPIPNIEPLGPALKGVDVEPSYMRPGTRNRAMPGDVNEWTEPATAGEGLYPGGWPRNSPVQYEGDLNEETPAQIARRERERQNQADYEGLPRNPGTGYEGRPMPGTANVDEYPFTGNIPQEPQVNTPGAGNQRLSYRQPLGDEQPYDPDSGPRESGYMLPAAPATYGDAGDEPQVPAYQNNNNGVNVSPESSDPHTVGMGDTATLGPPLSEAGPAAPESPFRPLYDTLGNVVGYVQHQAQAVSDAAYQGLAPLRDAAAAIDQGKGYGQVTSTPGEPDYVETTQNPITRALTTPITPPERPKPQYGPFDLSDPNAFPDQESRNRFQREQGGLSSDVAAIPYQAAEAGRQSVMDAAQSFADALRAGQEGRPLAAAGNALWSAAQAAGLPWTVAARTINEMLPEANVGGVGVGDAATSLDLIHLGIQGVNGLRNLPGALTPERLAAIHDAPGAVVGAARGLGTRVTEGLARNAENVAAADARMAAEGGTSTLGVFGSGGGSGGGARNIEARIAEAEDRLTTARAQLDSADAVFAQVTDGGTRDEIRAAQRAYSAVRQEYARASDAVQQLHEDRRLISGRIDEAGYGRPIDDAGIQTTADPRDASGAGDIPRTRDDTPRSASLNAILGAGGDLGVSGGAGRLGAVNRALGQGIRSTVAGGVGAAVNQEMNPDDPYAGVKGFAAGALLPPLAARGGIALARRLGRSAEGLSDAALATLGNVPNTPPGNQIARNVARAAQQQGQQIVNGTVVAASSKPANLIEIMQGYRYSVGMLGQLGTGILQAAAGPVSVADALAVDVVRQGLLKGYPVPAIIEAGSLVSGFKDAAVKALGTAIGFVPQSVRNAPDFRPPLAERMGGGLGKAAGYVMETPGRLSTQTPDAFFNTLFERMGQRRAANEIMMESGASRLDPVAQVQEVQRLLNNPTPDEAQRIAEGAKKFADDMTYKGKAGPVEEWLGSRFRPGNRPATANDSAARQVADLAGSFIMPFFGATFKIHKLAASHLPILGEVADRSIPQSERFARQIVGTGFVLWAADAAAKGLVTGPGPTDPDEKARWLAAGNQPFSTYLPGIGFVKSDNLAQAGPILKPIGAYYDAQRYGDPQSQDVVKNWNAVAKNMLSSFENFPVVQAVQAVYKMGQSPVEGAADLATTIGSSFVPAIVRANEASKDPNQRTVDTNAPMAEQIKQRALNRLGSIPGLGSRQDSPPVLNRETGEPMPNPRAGLGAFIPQTKPQQPQDPIITEMSTYGVNLDKSREKFSFTRAGADAPDGVQGTVPVPLKPAWQAEWLAARREAINQSGPGLTADPEYGLAPDAAKKQAWERMVRRAEQYADRAVKSAHWDEIEPMISGAPAAPPVRRAS